MSHATSATVEPDEPTVYHIRVQGHLDARWEQWLNHMTIAPQASGDSLLTGPIVDQAALHGVLTKLRDLGVPLISIERIEPAPHHRKDTT